MDKNNNFRYQPEEGFTSIIFSAVGVVVLVFLVVSIGVHNYLLPDESNLVTKFIIATLISGSILIIICCLVLGIFAIKLFSSNTSSVAVVRIKHHRIRSLDEIPYKGSRREFEFVV